MSQQNNLTKPKRNLARSFRQNPTNAERKLWSLLRNKKISAWRFRRQQPIGPFIVGFFCPGAKLIVELDGGQHNEAMNIERDQARTRWLAIRGYRVIRFWNFEVLKTPQAVLDAIWHALQ